MKKKCDSDILYSASHNFRDAAHADQQDILLIPQPSTSLADPLVRIDNDIEKT
jgi:hypothetical protein